MNRIYKIVWSKVLNDWVVTSEKGKNQGKATKSAKKRALTVMTALLSATCGLASATTEPPLEITNRNQNDINGSIYNGMMPQPNGNGIDTLKNGVIYNEQISGNRSVIFTAPDAKYNATRVSSPIEVNYWDVPADIRNNFEYYGIKMPHGNPVFNTGEDDRYGRKILLENSGAPNTYKGDTIVRESAQLTVGRHPETDYQLLGDNNDLFVEEYSTVSLYSKENVNNLVVDAKDAAVIRRSEDDKDLWFFPNIEDPNSDQFYKIENAPPGGSVTVNRDAALTVNGKTTLTGNGNFNTYLNAYGADLSLQQEATFDRGNLGIYDGSTVVAEDNLVFTGLYSGIFVRNSTLDVEGTVKKVSTEEFGSKNSDGKGDFTITNNAQVHFKDEVDLHDAVLNINNNNHFSHGSGYDHHGGTPNQPVAGWYSNTGAASAVTADKSIVLS